ncbi:MAG TPA: AAA family ATPase [Chitinophagaceae bacterium]|nr:AAA family ATPase [Chitinophagaceae bacterium]
MSTEKLELVRFEAESFMGIDKTDKVVIDFTRMRKNRFVELAGDQGQGKTSTLLGLMYAMCGNVPLEKKRLMNSIDKDISEELEFVYNEEKYKIDVSSSRISLKKELKNGKWTVQPSPVEMIKEIFGPVGMFPTHVKEMDGRKQIKFFQEMFGGGDDASKKMKKLEEEIETVFADRRDINRDIKTISSALEIEPLYQNREQSEARFAKTISAEKEKKAFDELSKKKADFDKYKSTLDMLEIDHKAAVEKVEELERLLLEAKEYEKEVSGRVDKGEKWVKENESIVAEFEKANNEWLNLSKTLSEQEKWKEILKRERLLIEKQDASVTKTGELDDLREKMLKEVKKCLPAVEGLTIKVATGLDKEDKQEGVFYTVPGKENEQGIHELSESEYADMWCKIWEVTEVPIVVIENISSFGSSFIKTLNQFVKNGGTVFYSKMDRKVKELQVEFKSKIE